MTRGVKVRSRDVKVKWIKAGKGTDIERKGERVKRRKKGMTYGKEEIKGQEMKGKGGFISWLTKKGRERRRGRRWEFERERKEEERCRRRGKKKDLEKC